MVSISLLNSLYYVLLVSLYACFTCLSPLLGLYGQERIRFDHSQVKKNAVSCTWRREALCVSWFRSSCAHNHYLLVNIFQNGSRIQY